MPDLTDAIRQRLDDPIDAALNADPYVAAIRAVLELHAPIGVYHACGHNHDKDVPADYDGGDTYHDLVCVEDIDWVCADGFEHHVCQICADAGWSTSYPCPTVERIAAALGVLETEADHA